MARLVSEYQVQLTARKNLKKRIDLKNELVKRNVLGSIRGICGDWEKSNSIWTMYEVGEKEKVNEKS